MIFGVVFFQVECPKYPGFCITRQRKEYPFIEIFHSPEQVIYSSLPIRLFKVFMSPCHIYVSSHQPVVGDEGCSCVIKSGG